MPSFRKKKPEQKQEFKAPDPEPVVGAIMNKFVAGYPVLHMYVGYGKWVPVSDLGKGGKGQEVTERTVLDHDGYKNYVRECAKAVKDMRPADLMENDARAMLWTNVLNLPDGVKRMVARVHEWEGLNSRDEFIPDTGKYELFVPTSWSDQYELVTTLGTDGNTYPVYDIDCQLDKLPYHMWDDCLFVPSTSNWHGYEQSPHNWTQFLEKHEKALPGNEGYLIMNRDKGWAGVRPPWHRKDWLVFEDSAASRSHHWINFDTSKGNQDQSGKQEDRPMSLAEMFETV